VPPLGTFRERVELFPEGMALPVNRARSSQPDVVGVLGEDNMLRRVVFNPGAAQQRRARFYVQGNVAAQKERAGQESAWRDVHRSSACLTTAINRALDSGSAKRLPVRHRAEVADVEHRQRRWLGCA
jgi:hypothetical protein